MKKRMNLLLLSLSVVASSQLMADCCPDERCYIPAGDPLTTCCGATPGIPYPATLDLDCGWDIYASSEWLYWKLVSFGPSNTTIANQNSLNGSQSFGVIQKFDYESGFRVTLGADVGPVLVEAKYTRYHTLQDQSVTAPDNFLLKAIVAGVTAPSFSNVSRSVNYKLDVLEVLARKPVYIGTRSTLDLYYGLGTIWTTANFDTTFRGLAGGSATNPNGTNQSHKKTWSTGPEVGMAAKGMLPWGFRLMGLFDLMIEYGSSSSDFVTNSFPGASAGTFNTLNNTTKLGTGMFMTRVYGQIGLGWESYFWCDRYHLSLFGAFETARYVSTAATGDLQLSRIMQISGFNLGGQIDF